MLPWFSIDRGVFGWLSLLSPFIVLLIGCQSETPSPRSLEAKTSSSAERPYSVSVLKLATDSTVVDSVNADSTVVDSTNRDDSLQDSTVKDFVESSSSISVSSSSIESSASIESSSSEEQSSSSEEYSSSSSSEIAIETIVSAASVDSASPDTVESAVPVNPVIEDTSLCANVPATVLCDKRDGQLYRTVQIGSQVWMAQNLNFAVSNSWCYSNSLENCSNYGRLYQWAAAMNLDNAYSHSLAGELLEEKHQGICPDGWYVPSDKDMDALVHFVQESNKAAGLASEEVGTSLRKDSGWEENDEEIDGTNRYGFAAIPAGYRDANGSFAFMGEEADFWVAEEVDNGTLAPHWSMYYANQTFNGEYKNLKAFAFSVRCIKR